MKALPLLGVTVIAILAACSRTSMSSGKTTSTGGGPEVSADALASPDSASDVADVVAAAEPPAMPSLPGQDAAADARSIEAPPAQSGANDPDCIIVVRTDVCCSQPFVLARHELGSDPCVQPFFASSPAPAECLARRSPPSCRYLDCVGVPPTRAAGRGQDGRCQFVDECETEDDCVWAFDARRCCDCPAYYPRSFVAGDRCLAAEGGPSADCPESRCASVRCIMPTCPTRTGACTAATAAAGLKVCAAM